MDNLSSKNLAALLNATLTSVSTCGCCRCGPDEDAAYEAYKEITGSDLYCDMDNGVKHTAMSVTKFGP